MTESLKQPSIFTANWGCVAFYQGKHVTGAWYYAIKSSEVNIISTDGSFGRAWGYDADGGNDVNFGATINNIDSQYGVYHLKWDMNTNTCTVTKL